MTLVKFKGSNGDKGFLSFFPVGNIVLYAVFGTDPRSPYRFTGHRCI